MNVFMFACSHNRSIGRVAGLPHALARGFLPKTTLSISPLLMLLLCQCLSARAIATPPDVVVIMADDMGYSDLGCFGGEILTPNLDSLASGGLRFTNFYSENMCWVSRAALLTGIYHKASMVNSALHPRCLTLPEALRANGYQTRMSGKWHLAGKRYSVFPNDRGFDSFYGILGGASSFFAPAHLYRDRLNIEQDAVKDPDYYFTDAISDQACKMIQSARASQPMFLSVAYTAAHWPLHAPDKDVKAYRGKYKLGWDELRRQRLDRMKQLGIVSEDIHLSKRHEKVPAWDQEPHQEWQQRRMEVYAAQVTVMDRGIGRIIESLKASGRFENTLIFFTIDNGGCHVEYTPDRKGDFLPQATRDGRPMRPGNLPEIMPGPEDTYQSYGHGWANASNTPFRLFKQYDHEGGIRTPMIAHWPVGIRSAEGRLKGKQVRSVAHLIDIMPTVLEVTGINPPTTRQDQTVFRRDGQSLAASFSGKALPQHRQLFFHHNKGKAYRDGDWKLVAVSKGDWELYNLADDPLEENNLARQETAKAETLQKAWDRESRRLAKLAKQ